MNDFRLLFATEKVDQTILDHLIKLAEEAKVHEKMQAMQSGEILNFMAPDKAKALSEKYTGY